MPVIPKPKIKRTILRKKKSFRVRPVSAVSAHDDRESLRLFERALIEGKDTSKDKKLQRKIKGAVTLANTRRLKGPFRKGALVTKGVPPW